MTLSLFLGALLLIQSTVGISGGGTQSPQLQAPANSTPDKDKCTLSGIVTSMQTGEPLRKAALHLILRNSPRGSAGAWQPPTGYSGTSSPDGSFRFESVEPGQYSLTAEKAGFLQTPYGSKSSRNGGSIVTLTKGQQLTDLKMQLVAQATVTGRVLDEDGDPVAGVSVEAVGRMWTSSGTVRYFPQGNAQTDETGAYRMANLAPGKYFVVAQPNRGARFAMNEKPAEPGKPQVKQTSTFYPSSLDKTGASSVDLKAGQELPGVDIRMRSVEVFHVRGKVAADFTANNGGPLILFLMSRDADMVRMFDDMAMVAQDHSFDIGNVAPGQYWLSSPNSKGASRQPVDVGSADVNGLAMTTQPEIVIHGFLEVAGAPAATAKDKSLEGIRVSLQPDDDAIMFNRSIASTKADGSFTLNNVAPGKFRVLVMNQPDGAYVKSMRFGNQDVPDTLLDLTQSTGGDLHINLHSGAPEVSGTVLKKQDSASGGSSTVPATSASVLLIPEDVTGNSRGVRMTTIDQNGAFTEKSLTPGVFYAVAYEPNDESVTIQAPPVLKQLMARGVKLEIKENDKQQIQLTLISQDELQAAIAASGVDNN